MSGRSVRSWRALFAALLIGMPSQALFSEAGRLKLQYKHIVMDVTPEEIRILEIGSVVAGADQADDVRFSAGLPRGYESLGVEGAEDVVAERDGFTARFPVGEDGRSRIVYSYAIDRDAASTLRFPLRYEIDALEILYPMELAVKDESGLLESEQGVSFGDRIFARLGGEQLSPDAVVTLRIEMPDSPAAATEPYVSRAAPQFHSRGHVRIWYQSALRALDPHATLAVIVLIIGSAAVLAIRRMLRNRYDLTERAETEDEPFLRLLHLKRILIDRIVEIERAASDGRSDPAEADDQVKSLKRRLVDTQMELENLAGSRTSIVT